MPTFHFSSHQTTEEVRKMNSTERQKIDDLRKQGYGYGKISKQLGISKSTISSYCKGSSDSTRCPVCGKKIKIIGGHRKRRYCSDSCRKEYWRLNKDKISRNPTCRYSCFYCHREFYDYKSKNPKFCSLSCYFKSRYGVAENERK